MVTQIGDLLKFPKNYIVNFVLKYVKKMVPDYSLPGSINFVDALANGDFQKFTPVEVGHEDTAFLQYTGGTTGVSKGAVLTHKNIISNLLQARAWIKNFITQKVERQLLHLCRFIISSHLQRTVFVFQVLGQLMF